MSAKILGLDIETAPHTAFVWGLFKENIPIDRLIETGRVLCFSAKWVGEKQIYFHSEQSGGRKRMIKAAHALLDQADAVLTYNGKRFDTPTLAMEFAKAKLTPPSPCVHIDLYQVVKKNFRLASKKLAHVLSEFGLTKKADHRGFITWIECMAGDKKAWKEMEVYNKQDVLSLEELYFYLLPWIDQHPNLGLYTDSLDPVCTNCGSEDLQARGYQFNRTLTYRRYRCNDCGTWVRAKTAINRNPVLTQIGA